ncbi:hypothetical protein BGAL_0429g00010 [Botrytis galanthina]|uniref:Uncharacterized protein n=1 Tax=Botrytis galanthina TaxID=278940 RepID=A0A4V4HTL5_9HELO|nr:hypothetical protein BGAL_0429g00010 [Botrytis galanthina]
MDIILGYVAERASIRSNFHLLEALNRSWIACINIMSYLVPWLHFFNKKVEKGGRGNQNTKIYFSMSGARQKES